jgi:DNA-binding NtrC family response regulator
MTAKALVLEDSATQARIVARMVEAQNWECIHCSTVEAAMDSLGRSAFQAMFLDVFVGEANALDHLETFRALAPHCPIVIMTAGSKKEAIEETLATARRAHVDFVVQKPFDTDEVAAIIAAAYEDLEARRRKKHVLIIDDSATIQRLASGILAGAGYHVSTAETMEDAFERIDIANLHLAIVDIYMPGIGGLEGIKKLRATWPKLKLIAISAGIGSDDAQSILASAAEMGADAELPKPFDRETLVSLADKLVA